MGELVREIEVDAPLERIWQVVSDIDNEPEYWLGTREVINRRREGNVTERTIVSNFRGARIEQRVTLSPPESVEVEYLRGTTVGRKSVRIIASGASKNVVRAIWDVRFTGALVLITPMIRNHIAKGTVNALARIKEVAEGRPAAPPPAPET